MIKNILITVALILFVFSANAKTQDSVGNKIVNGKRFLVYKVGKGEGVYAIARRYNLPANDIFEANDGSKEGLKLGQTILIPRGLAKNIDPTPVAKPSNKNTVIKTNTHTVVKGNTLNNIAKEYNTTVEDLKKLNNLSDGNIKLGQKLKVPRAIENTEPAAVVVIDTYTKEREREIVQVVEDSPSQPVAPLPTKIYDTMEGDEVSENGKAIISSEGDLYQERSFVLHPTAKVGTIVMIVNPANNQAVFARVVGAYKTNDGSVLKMSKTVASKLGLTEDAEVKVSYAK